MYSLASPGPRLGQVPSSLALHDLTRLVRVCLHSLQVRHRRAHSESLYSPCPRGHASDRSGRGIARLHLPCTASLASSGFTHRPRLGAGGRRGPASESIASPGPWPERSGRGQTSKSGSPGSGRVLASESHTSELCPSCVQKQILINKKKFKKSMLGHMHITSNN